MSEITVTIPSPIQVTVTPPQPVEATITPVSPEIESAIAGLTQLTSDLEESTRDLATAVEILQGTGTPFELTTLSNTVSSISATVSQIQSQIEAEITALETGLESKAPQSQVTAIDAALGQLTAAVAQFQTALEGKAPASHPHTIAAITGLTTALNDLQGQINGLQQQDSDLAAIAALNTQTFGRSLLTLTSLAAAKALLEIPSASTGQPTASELTYTVSQSSIWPGTSAVTPAVLTDGNINTGGGTNTSGANWIKADLGSAKTIERLTVAGGNPPTYSGAASALNNRLVQVSLDEMTWTTLLTVTGATDTAVSLFVLPTVKARYLRLFISPGGVGTTELRIFGY
jgi:DNA-binding FrmR family transcriptional regulator